MSAESLKYMWIEQEYVKIYFLLKFIFAVLIFLLTLHISKKLCRVYHYLWQYLANQTFAFGLKNLTTEDVNVYLFKQYNVLPFRAISPLHNPLYTMSMLVMFGWCSLMFLVFHFNLLFCKAYQQNNDNGLNNSAICTISIYDTFAICALC